MKIDMSKIRIVNAKPGDSFIMADNEVIMLKIVPQIPLVQKHDETFTELNYRED